MPSLPYPNTNQFKVVQFRRGSTTDNNALLGAQGEITVDLDKKTAVIHDGVQVGGFPLRRDDAEFARPNYIEFKTAVVQNGVPFLAIATDANPPVAKAINSFIGVAEFTPLSGQQIYGLFPMPDNWPGTSISCVIVWRTVDVTNSVHWDLQIGGLNDGDVLENFTFGSSLPFPASLPTTPNELNSTTLVLSPSDLTTIMPSGEFLFKFGRSTLDNSTYPAQVFSVRFNVDRLSV